MEESGVGIKNIGNPPHIWWHLKSLRLDDFCKVCAYSYKLGESVEGRKH